MVLGKKKKREVLKSSDRRIQIGPAGGNLFISRDKQAQDRAARRIKTGMRTVAVSGGLVLLLAAGLFAWYYLVPYFHEELRLETSSSSQPLPSQIEGLSSLPVYDEMGLTVYGDEVCLFVINESAPAEKGQAPALSEVNGVQVDERIGEAVRLMVSAAKEDGLSLTFTEGYVSFEQQEKRFEEETEKLRKLGKTTVMARAEAKSITPMAGESDFQTGLCLRVSGSPQTFEDSRTYSWLKRNMGKYGFVFRYPEYKEEYTGCKADPTVIRYVGSAHAAAMQQRSVCLEEYILYLESQ